jgi:hypothetical protein
MTEGRSAIRIRIRFRPSTAPLYPGDGAVERAWSEFRYTLYSYGLPPSPI